MGINAWPCKAQAAYAFTAAPTTTKALVAPLVPGMPESSAGGHDRHLAYLAARAERGHYRATSRPERFRFVSSVQKFELQDRQAQEHRRLAARSMPAPTWSQGYEAMRLKSHEGTRLQATRIRGCQSAKKLWGHKAATALSRHRRRHVHRGFARAGIQMTASPVILSTGMPIPARWVCRRRC